MASTTRYEISHVSRCLYASPVRGCVMSLCLKPQGTIITPLSSLAFRIIGVVCV